MSEIHAQAGLPQLTNMADQLTPEESITFVNFVKNHLGQIAYDRCVCSDDICHTGGTDTDFYTVIYPKMVAQGWNFNAAFEFGTTKETDKSAAMIIWVTLDENKTKEQRDNGAALDGKMWFNVRFSTRPKQPKGVLTTDTDPSQVSPKYPNITEEE